MSNAPPPGPEADQERETRLRFPHWRRLRSPRDFERVYADRRSGDALLLVFAAKNDLGWTRIGLSVSRRHGNSVVRHRLRRLLREAYRLEQRQVPEGLDLVLVPRPGAAGAPLEDLRRSLVRQTQRLAGGKG